MYVICRPLSDENARQDYLHVTGICIRDRNVMLILQDLGEYRDINLDKFDVEVSED